MTAEDLRKDWEIRTGRFVNPRYSSLGKLWADDYVHSIESRILSLEATRAREIAEARMEEAQDIEAFVNTFASVDEKGNRYLNVNDYRAFVKTLEQRALQSPQEAKP